MPLDLVSRLNRAEAMGTGVKLSKIDVLDINAQMKSLAKFYLSFEQVALQLTVPPESLLETIINVLCLDGGTSAVTIRKDKAGWTLLKGGAMEQWSGPSLSEAVDAYRSSMGVDPLSGIKLTIAGPAVRQSIEGA